jgi:cytochrome c5
VSKQDSRFFSIFSAVLGILITVAILLFVFAKVVGTGSQVQQVESDALRIAAVDERTRPFARVAVAGQDNSAMQIAEESSGSPSAVGLPVPRNAEELYNAACSACHAQGIGGAPRIGRPPGTLSRIPLVSSRF